MSEGNLVYLSIASAFEDVVKVCDMDSQELHSYIDLLNKSNESSFLAFKSKLVSKFMMSSKPYFSSKA